MNLAVVNEAVTEMNGVEHQFTEEEKKLLLSSSHSEAAARKTRFLLLKLWHIQRIRLSRTRLWSHTGLNMI